MTTTTQAQLNNPRAFLKYEVRLLAANNRWGKVIQQNFATLMDAEMVADKWNMAHPNRRCGCCQTLGFTF